MIPRGETEVFLSKTLGESIARKAVVTMDELNSICDTDPVDVGAFYLRFRSLLSLYFEHSLAEEGELAIEECVDAAVFDLVFTRKIYAFERRSDYFWWSYIHKTASKVVALNVTRRKEIGTWAWCIASDFDESEKDFFRIKRKHLEKLIKDGSIFSLIESANSVDSNIGNMLNLEFKRYLKEGDTSVLVSAYSNLLKARRKRSNSCQKTLKQIFFRDRPSRRTPRK